MAKLGMATPGMTALEIVVIIVSYKTAELSIQALQSVEAERAANTHLNIRAIVVDNASGDAEPLNAAIQQHSWASWVTLIASPVNGGFGYGNNVGFKHALSQQKVAFFYLLNPDARCMPGAIASLIDAFQQAPNIGIAGSSFYNEDGSVWPIAFRFPSLLGEVDSGLKLGIVTKLLKKWSIAVHMPQIAQATDWIAGASMMIKADVVQKLQGFDESFFLYCEETDLCHRAKKLGILTWYAPASKVTHIAGQSTKVTERNAARKRFPAYWYESRSMYYLKNHGLTYAVAADIVTVVTNLLGNLRLNLSGRGSPTPLYFFTDVIKNSAIFPHIRRKKAFRSMLNGQ